jgi:hypothetical protein
MRWLWAKMTGLRNQEPEAMLDHELRNSCQNLLDRVAQLKDSL